MPPYCYPSISEEETEAHGLPPGNLSTALTLANGNESDASLAALGGHIFHWTTPVSEMKTSTSRIYHDGCPSHPRLSNWDF